MGLAHKKSSFHVNVPYGRGVRNANLVDFLIRAQRLKESRLPEDTARAADYFYVLGFMYTNLGEEQEARACFERTLQLKPHYNPSLEGLGTAPISLRDRRKQEKEELRDYMKDNYARGRVETLFWEFVNSGKNNVP